MKLLPFPIPRVRTILFVIILLVFFLIYNAPARLVHYVLPPNEGTVLPYDIQGTIWNGSIGTLFVQTPKQWLHFNQLRWQLSPWHLFAGQLRYRVTLQYLRHPAFAHIVLHFGGIDMEQVQMSGLPLKHFRDLLPLPLDGQLIINLERVELRHREITTIQGAVAWSGAAAIIGSNVEDFGDFSMKITTPEEGQFAGELTDFGGHLALNGGATYQDKKFSVKVEIEVRDSASPSLRHGVQLIARPLGNNRFLLEYSGNVP